jgi:cbb3-type cytochrome oxidase subunit 3
MPIDNSCFSVNSFRKRNFLSFIGFETFFLKGVTTMDKEAVYNFLGNIFGWLSTHQSVAIVLIILVLGIVIWLLLRAKKYRRQAENEAYLKKKEIGEKDALIEEQATKLTALQKKMDDQQSFISEALLRTIRTLTGYDADQLPIFFKALTRSSENPLHLADHQAVSAPAVQEAEGDSADDREINDSKEKFASDEDASGEDSSDDSEAKEKFASNDEFSETDETTEKLESDGDTLENGAAKEEMTPDNDASEEDDSKKEKSTSDDETEDGSDKNKPVDG